MRLPLSAHTLRALAAALILASGLPSALPAPAQVANKQIYPDPTSAHDDLKFALARAPREHKRVILDFGGNWCGDCRVLDLYFEQAPNAELLGKYFIKVDVNVGRFDANTDLAKKYGVPLDRGVPAMVVLDSDGKLLYSQKNGEFESMRRLQPTDVTAFLQRWKP